MELTVKYKSWNCFLDIQEFVNGGLCIDLIDSSTYEPVITINKWFKEVPPNCIALDSNNCGNDLANILLNSEVIVGERLFVIENGMCRYPVYQLSEKVKVNSN